MTNGEKFKTAKERMEAFKNFCERNKRMGCHACPCWQVGENWDLKCSFLWLDLEAEEEKPMPCPFCGGIRSLGFLRDGMPTYVGCGCGYRSPLCNSADEAIARHNALCRKVKGGEP